MYYPVHIEYTSGIKRSIKLNSLVELKAAVSTIAYDILEGNVKDSYFFVGCRYAALTSNNRQSHVTYIANSVLAKLVKTRNLFTLPDTFTALIAKLR